jgi:probable F420-dependent oxidoreductase
MREFVEALRAIWACWDEGTRLKFEGTYYNFDLMTPYFNPGPQPYGAPKVFLAAVNKGMAALAGEVADGIKLHSFCTPLYVERVIEPAIAEGLKAAGKRRSDFEISVPSFIATGEDDVKMEAAIAATRREIGFYASTAAYRAVLDTHGWGALHEEAREQVRRGDWDTLGKLVDDEVLQTFAVVAPPDELGRRFSEMFANTEVQRVSFNFSYPTDDDLPARCRRSFGTE